MVTARLSIRDIVRTQSKTPGQAGYAFAKNWPGLNNVYPRPILARKIRAISVNIAGSGVAVTAASGQILSKSVTSLNKSKRVTIAYASAAFPSGKSPVIRPATCVPPKSSKGVHRHWPRPNYSSLVLVRANILNRQPRLMNDYDDVESMDWQID